MLIESWRYVNHKGEANEIMVLCRGVIKCHNIYEKDLKILLIKKIKLTRYRA